MLTLENLRGKAISQAERVTCVRGGLLGWSQREFADRLTRAGVRGGSYASVRRYEAGLRKPSLEFLKGLAELAQVSLTWLLEGLGPPELFCRDGDSVPEWGAEVGARGPLAAEMIQAETTFRERFIFRVHGLTEVEAVGAGVPARSEGAVTAALKSFSQRTEYRRVRRRQTTQAHLLDELWFCYLDAAEAEGADQWAESMIGYVETVLRAHRPKSVAIRRLLTFLYSEALGSQWPPAQLARLDRYRDALLGRYASDTKAKLELGEWQWRADQIDIEDCISPEDRLAWLEEHGVEVGASKEELQALYRAANTWIWWPVTGGEDARAAVEAAKAADPPGGAGRRPKPASADG